MPQLQPDVFAPQLIWLAITFLILYLAMSRLALPRIEHVIVERRSRIGGDLEKARAAQQLASEEMARYDAAIAAARAKAQALARTAREELDGELAKEREAADASNAAEADRARQRIGDFKTRALAGLDEMAAGAVGDIVKQLAGIDASSGDVLDALKRGKKE